MEPDGQAPTLNQAPQRLAMYIVISIPNRKSVACGVSHFITLLLMLWLKATLILSHPQRLRIRPIIKVGS